MKIKSINVGMPTKLTYNGKEISTGIEKRPVKEPIYLNVLNFVGDGQADLKNHGGFDKAVCVYSYEHYAYWEKDLSVQLDYGAFGENLTVTGMLEEEVYVGDIFQLGEAKVQVSQPRYPCHKLAKKHQKPDLPERVLQTGFTGFYFRVLQEGYVDLNSTVTKVKSHPLHVSVKYVIQTIQQGSSAHQESIRHILKVDELSESMRSMFTKWLK